ncbi:MAG TPA: molecular chaperone TorD family protein [Azospirillum sp.]|nr:molecular chaperone TorD family protein [Azospirillum sp.]
MTAPDFDQGRARGEAYLFLATLYAGQPTADLLAGMAAAADRLSGDDGAAGEIMKALAGESDLEALTLRLATEHTRLFRGVREGYGPPPPYEALWREGQMMGDSTVAVATAFLEAGYEYDGAWGPCDHLAEELRFMAALCMAEDTLDRQEAFLTRHLSAWVPTYCQALAEQTREPFYGALARVTAEIVAQDGEYVRSLLWQPPDALVRERGV